MMADPREKDHVETTVFVMPGHAAPSTLVELPNGDIIDYAVIDAMSPEEFDAWYANMTSSDPADIETESST